MNRHLSPSSCIMIASTATRLWHLPLDVWANRASHLCSNEPRQNPRVYSLLPHPNLTNYIRRVSQRYILSATRKAKSRPPARVHMHIHILNQLPRNLPFPRPPARARAIHGVRALRPAHAAQRRQGACEAGYQRAERRRESAAEGNRGRNAGPVRIGLLH
jgi:hypothetical protein